MDFLWKFNNVCIGFGCIFYVIYIYWLIKCFDIKECFMLYFERLWILKWGMCEMVKIIVIDVFFFIIGVVY